MNIVTKSGTNNLQGSFFELFRDTKMNARTENEKLSDVDKQDYRRNQFGGSFGGPIVKDKAHFFGAVERTQQDTFRRSRRRGCSRTWTACTRRRIRENLLTVKVTANLNPAQYLSVRYGCNKNSQPYGATPHTPPDDWGDSATSSTRST